MKEDKGESKMTKNEESKDLYVITRSNVDDDEDMYTENLAVVDKAGLDAASEILKDENYGYEKFEINKGLENRRPVVVMQYSVEYDEKSKRFVLVFGLRHETYNLDCYYDRSRYEKIKFGDIPFIDPGLYNFIIESDTENGKLSKSSSDARKLYASMLAGIRQERVYFKKDMSVDYDDIAWKIADKWRTVVFESIRTNGVEKTVAYLKKQFNPNCLCQHFSFSESRYENMPFCTTIWGGENDMDEHHQPTRIILKRKGRMMDKITNPIVSTQMPVHKNQLKD